MKSNENNDSFKNKLALFNNGPRKSARIELPKKDNNINKILEKFQPQKSNEINNKNTNLNDSKKNEKKENKDKPKAENQKIKERNSKMNVSHHINNNIKDNAKPKNQETFESIKKNDKKIPIPQKNEDIPRTNTSSNNNNVFEMIKKLNQNEEKNKAVQPGNKGQNKPIETGNKYNNNNKINEEKNKNVTNSDKKVNDNKGKNMVNNNNKKIIETQNKIIQNNNKNNNNNNCFNDDEIINRSKTICLNKNAVKEMQSQKNNNPQKNKFLDNIQMFSKNAKDKAKPLNQEKNMKNEYLTMNSAPINSDNKNESSTNFKDKIKSFEIKHNENNQNIIQKPKEIIKINNQENEENINKLSSIKRNSVGIELKTEQKGINDFIKKFSNKPIKSISKEEDKIEKEKNEEIIKSQIPKNISQAQFEKSNTSKTKETNNSSKNIDISIDNLEVKEETLCGRSSETPIIDSINDKRNKSKSNPQNSGNNKNDAEFCLLEQKPINSELQENSFCIAFFITSFPKDPKIIENSQKLKADCTHEECSLLPGFQPEIIYKYPQKDSKALEINNILASICFPNSIKVCLLDKEDSVFTVKNYRSCFTNQVGDRFYSMMYHIYVKMDFINFFNKYGSDIFTKLSMEFKSDVKKEVDKKNKLLKEIKSKKYYYVPYCLCLISKFPFFPQMEKCLESIMETLKNTKIEKDELNEVIAFLVKSIPSPYANTSVFFPVPNCSDIIELTPCFYQEMAINGDNPISLLDNIKVSNLVLLFRLLLFEQKILLISEDYDTLTQVSLNLISLLYPFTWIHIFIPIITEKMLKYLQSFLPFLNGMHKSLYQKENVQTILYKSHKDLFIFDIDKNKFEISCNLYDKKKTDPIKFLNRQIPPLPKNIVDIVEPQLNVLKSYYNGHSSDNYLINYIKCKALFIQVFIELLSNYKKYLAFIDDLPVFNTGAFLREKPESDKVFFKELTTTQLFQIFMQNALSYINNKNKNYYFDELIELYLRVKEIDEKRHKTYFLMLNSEFQNNINMHLFTIKKNYFIYPSHLKLLQPIINNLSIQKGRKLMQDTAYYLQKNFTNRHLLNEKGIIKENKRIINNDINLSNENDFNNYGYYITPEEIEEENLKKNEKKQKKIIFEDNKINIVNDNNNLKQINDKKEKKEEQEKKEEEILSTADKEDIRDNIRETLTRVFKSERVNVVKDSSVLLSSIEKMYGVNYFVDVFEQNRISKEVKVISGDSFIILLEVIYRLLLRLKVCERDNIYSIKLIKTSIYFKAIVNKIEYILFEKIIEKLTKNYKLYNEIHFWDLWIEEELSPIDKEILNEFKKIVEDKDRYHYIDNENEQLANFKANYKDEVKKARKYMVKMKLNKSFMLSVIEELFNKYFKDDIEFEEFKKNLVKEIMDLK